MTFWLLNAITATRLLVCAPTWFLCWWKRPRGMVLWMFLALLWFVGTDHLDGQWARETRTGTPPESIRPLLTNVDDLGRTYTFESTLGYWLDHLADFFFYGVVVLSLIKGSREPGVRRRPITRASQPPAPPALPSAPPPAAPDEPQSP